METRWLGRRIWTYIFSWRQNHNYLLNKHWQPPSPHHPQTYQKDILHPETKKKPPQGSVDGRGGWERQDHVYIWASPSAVHLKLSRHRQLATPQYKTREKATTRQQEGCNCDKIKPHTHGWVTHKLVKYFITEVLPPGCKLWALHQAPQPGGLALGGGAPKAFGFEGQWV